MVHMNENTCKVLVSVADMIWMLNVCFHILNTWNLVLMVVIEVVPCPCEDSLTDLPSPLNSKHQEGRALFGTRSIGFLHYSFILM